MERRSKRRVSRRDLRADASSDTTRRVGCCAGIGGGEDGAVVLRRWDRPLAGIWGTKGVDEKDMACTAVDLRRAFLRDEA
jgi:hypothetical protein